MATALTVTPVEEGTLGVTADFYDDAGSAVTPTSMTWTLTDENGTIINSREDVAVGALAASITITLSGDDLLILSSSDEGLRYITFEGTYDSTALGSGLPIKAVASFYIENLIVVT
jgi:hypothetical protein